MLTHGLVGKEGRLKRVAWHSVRITGRKRIISCIILFQNKNKNYYNKSMAFHIMYTYIVIIMRVEKKKRTDCVRGKGRVTEEFSYRDLVYD